MRRRGKCVRLWGRGSCGAGAGGKRGGGDVVHGAGVSAPVGLEGSGVIVEEVVAVLAEVGLALGLVGGGVGLEFGDELGERAGREIGEVVGLGEGVGLRPHGADAGGV